MGFDTHRETGKVGSRLGTETGILPGIDGTSVFASTFRGRGLFRE